MLVDINLLPQKEPKKVNLIITLSSLLLIIILVGAYYLWQINSTKSEVASLESQISITMKVVENQEQSNSTAEASSSVSQLKSAIKWANDYPIETIPVMHHLTSLLPERGFIQNFAYTEAGTITLTVQFDSAREAAYFLDDLHDSKWIKEATLSSLAQSETTSVNTESSTTTQTDMTSSTTTATSQSTTTSTTNQSNTTDVNPTTTDQSAAGTTTNATTGANGTLSNSNTGTSTENNENILPRYTGQFEITLDKDYVKKAIKKSDEKGVTGT